MKLALFTLNVIFSFCCCRSYTASEQALVLWNKLVGRHTLPETHPSHPIKLKYQGIERIPCSAKTNKSCQDYLKMKDNSHSNTSNTTKSSYYCVAFFLFLIPLLFITINAI